MAELQPVTPGDINALSSDDSVFVRSRPAEVVRVVVLGALAGILTAFIGWLLDRYVVTPIFCNGDTSSICNNGGLTAYYAASVVVSLLATVVLANWQIFRPLLIVLATFAVTWGFKKYALHIADQQPLEYYAYSAIVFALCYLLFYWLLRLHNFMVSLFFVVIAVIGIRLFITS